MERRTYNSTSDCTQLTMSYDLNGNLNTQKDDFGKVKG